MTSKPASESTESTENENDEYSDSSSTVKPKQFRKVLCIPSDNSENDSDAVIIEIPPTVWRSPLKERTKIVTRRRKIADKQFLNEEAGMQF